MRLIKVPEDGKATQRIDFVDITGTQDIPRYAILSHTWNVDEVLFDDVRLGLYSKKRGFRKIEFAMAKARTHKLRYLWVDTCCINKSSSAELSEAINSMYNWYKLSAMCFAYLEDVTVDKDAPNFAQQFRSSRWFTRGW